MSNWHETTKAKTCPACGHAGWCAWSPDGVLLRCMRTGMTPAGMRRIKADGNGGTLYGVDDPARRPRSSTGYRPAPKAAPDAAVNWKHEGDRLRAAITDSILATLAETTGIPVKAWAMLSPGWAGGNDLRRLRASGAGWAENPPDGAWAFTEHAGDGRIVGLHLRASDGRKGAPAGGKRGLIVPRGLHQMSDPLLIVEGASDVAACCALGLAAAGRPSNRSGADDLAMLADGRTVLIVGERDGKDTGAWPGRDGAKVVAQQLAGHWGEPVRWTLPPLGVKDLREWVRAKLAGGLDVNDATAVKAAAAELLAALEVEAKNAKAERRSQADALVDLARERYRLGKSNDGDTFAVTLEGPNIAIMFRGGGSGLRAALAKAYRERTGKTPSASALADTLVALEGMAHDSSPEPVGLRVAEHEGGIVLDLADVTGRVVLLTPDGWAVEAVAPVLFRRTALTMPLPEPIQAAPADLAGLRDLLNVDDDTWPLVVGWLVAALLPGIPHPVLMLGGEQGTGKSSAARILVGLIDPSGAPLRSEPRDVEGWAIAAAGSWVVCLDNVSHIGPWLSDSICKAVTGDGVVRRKLYTDSDLAVLSFRLCVILTSIDAGALRGDLGERLMLADLQRIPDDRRRTEAELIAAYVEARPRLLGALLSATSQTLAALPNIKLKTMPRMADFARVLAALDTACPELTAGKALALFDAQRKRIADEVVDSDPVALAVLRLMEHRQTWQGTAGDLLEALAALKPVPAPKDWPANGRAMSGRLRRVRPALVGVGIQYDPPAKTDKTRTHRLEKTGERPPEPPVPPHVLDPVMGIDVLAGPYPGDAVGGDDHAQALSPGDRPGETLDFEAVAPPSGDVGGMGGAAPATSADGRERGEL